MKPNVNLVFSLAIVSFHAYLGEECFYFCTYVDTSLH